MKKKENMPTAGTGYWVTIYPSHLTNDDELRQKYPPGGLAYFLSETLEILEDEGIVLIGIISGSDNTSEMLVIPLAKLNLSEQQFLGLLQGHPDLYEYYMQRLRSIDASIGDRNLSGEEIYQRLEEASLSASNAFTGDGIERYDDDFIEIETI